MAETQHMNPCKILRKSIHTFLTHFHHFTSSPTLLCFPFSLYILLHQAPKTTETRPDFLLLLKLSHTLSSLPLSLSFLLLSKSSTIQFLRGRLHPPPPESAYLTLLHTQFYNLLILLSSNSASFALLYIAPESAAAIISGAGAVFVANTVVLCNFNLIASGWEGKGGVFTILRSCVLIRNRVSTALLLALPANLAMAAIESIFRFRIYGSGAAERSGWAVAAEALLIAYLYSVLIVGDTIVGSFFYTSCKEEEGVGMVYQSDMNKLVSLEEGDLNLD